MMTTSVEEEEIKMEIEAAQAVYGDYCTVFTVCPPHLRVHIMPRTADVSSQQFVEADIEIRAGSLYPKVPPNIKVIDTKGLDEEKLEHLYSSLHDKAAELASCSMLVALCEEAVERLTIMNQPDGECPLCLDPLVLHDDESGHLGYMKLMSCFHCFHSDCIIRWWKWLQVQNYSENSGSRMPSFTDNNACCPVCRKVFHIEDIEHVVNLVGSQITQLDLDEKGIDDGEKLLETDWETRRREEFEAILQSQKERGGIIEPRKDGVLFTSLSISDLIREATQEINSEAMAQHQTVHEVTDKPESSGQRSRASKRRQNQRSRSSTVKRDSYCHSDRPQVSKPITKHEPHGTPDKASPSQPRYTDRRKDARTAQSQTKLWIKKGTDGGVR